MNKREFDIECNGDPPPLLLDGIYPAEGKDWQERPYFFGRKMVVSWSVFVAMDFRQSVTLCNYYNIQRAGGGQIVAGRHSAYYKDWVASNGGKIPDRRRWMSPDTFVGKRVWVRIVSIRKDIRGPLHPSLYYSRIGQVMRPLGETEIVLKIPLELDEFNWQAL
jgi:hypothetical protein